MDLVSILARAKDTLFHEIGFVASVAMSVGATVIYVCGICTLPPIYNNMNQGAIEGVYYLTYLVSGVFFVISSVLYVLETQPTWYTPVTASAGMAYWGVEPDRLRGLGPGGFVWLL
jgi:hypothetical protein